jgi:tetratricopeptide (TPR) repeat protein
VLVYRSALQRWPANLSLAMGLGNSLHAAGDLGAAAQAFEAAADRHDSAAAWVNLASTRLDLDQADAALQAAQRAVGRKDPAFAAAAAEVLARAQTALARPGASPIVPR